jgi:uncharacterized protein YbjT (DUF2867 family)
MKVLLTGAGGFIGSALLQALLAAGHEVRAIARDPRRVPAAAEAVRLDLRDALAVAVWAPLLDGIDAVVNAAGILREERIGDFDRVHRQAPAALLEACAARGLRFVQVSALGDPADGEFVASKHRFDAELLARHRSAVVLRPSVVLSLHGSYGGTSLLRALAALPLLPLPAGGMQPLQPLLLDDLAALLLRCLQSGIADGRIIHAVGPEVLSLRELLQALRRWLQWRPAAVLAVPAVLVRVVAAIGERVGHGPLGRTMRAMLERGNVAPADGWQQAFEATGVATASVRRALQTSPSHVQDRWHARLYFLRPMIAAVLVLTWVISGVAGLLAAPAASASILDAIAIPAAWQAPLVLATSLWNLLLALLFAGGWRPRMVLALMLLSVLGYTLTLGLLAPLLWLEPLGGVLKNLGLLVLLLVYIALEEQR